MFNKCQRKTVNILKYSKKILQIVHNISPHSKKMKQIFNGKYN